MSLQKADTFSIQVLTSGNFPDWLAKKPRRGPKARKIPGNPPRGPIHNRNLVDKAHRTQQPQIPAKVEKQQTVETRKPVQYYTWWLDCDGEFLLWDYLVRIYVSGCETKYPGWNPVTTETDIGYMAHPPPNLNPTTFMPYSYVYAWQPDGAPVHPVAMYDQKSELPEFKLDSPLDPEQKYELPGFKPETPWAPLGSVGHGQLQWSPEYFSGDTCSRCEF